ncbi:MAG: NINE protein [Alphaproteobacteria bacterium]|nr:NINE protein [Alphaproteobacteria bacterium]
MNKIPKDLKNKMSHILKNLKNMTNNVLNSKMSNILKDKINSILKKIKDIYRMEMEAYKENKMNNILSKIKECTKGSKVKVFFECDRGNEFVEGVVKGISKTKKQITIKTIDGEWDIDFKDIRQIETETNSVQQKTYENPEKEIARPGLSQYGYCTLALFFGHLGVHNFYIGKVGSAVVQLLAPIVAPFIAGAIAGSSARNPIYAMFSGAKAGILSEAIVSTIISFWVFVELLQTNYDADGRPLRPSNKSVMVCSIFVFIQFVLSVVWTIKLIAAMS